MKFAALLALLLTISSAAQNKPEARPRVRDLGIKVGVLPAGPLDAITDVVGVRVGHTTIVRDGDQTRGDARENEALLAVSSAVGQAPPQSRQDPLSVRLGVFKLENQTIFDGLALLNQAVPVGFAVERELTSKESPRLADVRRFTARIENSTIREVLNRLIKLDPRYDWSEDHNVVNVFPQQTESDPNYPLTQRIADCEIRGAKTSSAAALEAARCTSPPQQLAVQLIGSTELDKPVNLMLQDVSLRQALNRIAQSFGPSYGWQFTGTTDFRLVIFHMRLSLPAQKPARPEAGPQSDR